MAVEFEIAATLYSKLKLTHFLHKSAFSFLKNNDNLTYDMTAKKHLAMNLLYIFFDCTTKITLMVEKGSAAFHRSSDQKIFLINSFHFFIIIAVVKKHQYFSKNLLDFKMKVSEIIYRP